MPELPEVETVAISLRESIVGLVVRSIHKLTDKRLRTEFDEEIVRVFLGKKVDDISRRGKCLILSWRDCDQLLMFHFGLTGRLFYYSATTLKEEYQTKKHDHFLINFVDGSVLVFNDKRRFGFIQMCEKANFNNHPAIVSIGIDPFVMSFDFLLNALKRRSLTIKAFLMNNSIICGIGNIYANEILFASKILPTRYSNDLLLQEVENLYPQITHILKVAISKGGSSISDYQHLDGQLGGFQRDFTVYGREGQGCYYCASKIIRIKQNNRSSFFCPSCQE